MDARLALAESGIGVAEAMFLLRQNFEIRSEN